jgi:signal transduction histidine kinase
MVEKIKKNADIRIVVMAVLYYTSAHLGFLLSFPETLSSPAWPPTGIAFALIIMLGYRSWPGITIGSMVVQSVVFWRSGLLFDLNTIFASTFTSFGNTVEALVGYFLLKGIIKEDSPFTKTTDTFKYLFISVTMSFIGAAIGTASQVFNNIIPMENWPYRLTSWWIGSTVSVLLFSSFTLSWSYGSFNLRWSIRKVGEMGIFFVALSLIFLPLNVPTIGPIMERSLPFLITPFLLWLAFRFNLQSAMSAVIILSMAAIYFTVKGEGPFVLDNADNSLIILQIFTGVMSITAIILSATVHEREEARTALKVFNESLEAKVEERTKELNEEINNRKKTEEKIRHSNSQLKKTNSELDNFVYSVSHDLRAPVASVKGLTNLALKEEDLQKVRDYITMIHKSAEKQDEFIKEILDISRNARLRVSCEKIGLDSMVNEICDQVRYLNGNKKVKTNIKITGDSVFYSDEKRIKVVLNNIISNAVKYTNGKQPVVDISIDVNSKESKIVIEDNGIGIDKQYLDKIYDMFFRASEISNGSGLGLYIVKETLEKLKGEIEIESDLGKGTKVSIKVPQSKRRPKKIVEEVAISDN